ncbi:presqualene diphosphate synthase HpnD [Sphingomonas morindae]|uniref:Presqualene diphosphate synthase HpnD n=1 Tax=Sphingomonas morindae TaxID=1541170 RepID=A0ABY4X463_9SPHN|nr:presqualene diphosphate synthase HpnD [Sphingomonas morindae]USI71666.1 presqualene diphosphate synthase HpnD [Sphingomonas morindae]
MSAPAAAGSSFYAGMRVLPRRERHAMYAIYAFCREVDDIADDQRGARPERARALEGWRRDLDDLYAGGPGGRAAFLAEAVRDFALERADFEAVIDGMAMDVAEDMRWPPMATLDLYCDRVASAVGRLSVNVFGMERATGVKLSHHLGRALQLTNILRDIDEDAAIGRLYLPREALEAAGIGLGDIDQVIADPRLDAACRTLLAEAERHYAAADAILRDRPAGHLIAPRLMSSAYGALLRRMKAVGWRAPRRRVRHNRLALAWTLLALRLGR